MYSWSPWRGCHKISEGCHHCYVHRGDARRGWDTSIVRKTDKFDLPLKRNKKGEYSWKPGNIVAMCFSTDFFVEEADEWRAEAWSMIRTRKDLVFFMITKRIDRFYVGLPADWGDGYDNVIICCTVENQDRADYRLPIFRDLPVRHKMIVCEPLLESINIRPYLGAWVKQIAVGGEAGSEARLCNFDWVLDIRQQCIEFDVPFMFRQTGNNFVKEGQRYKIPRKFTFSQARKAAINYKALPSVYVKDGKMNEEMKIYFPEDNRGEASSE
ncbi:DUF5131 family protein [Paludibacter sp. 221]|uniref:DUF5131 family protein n=1 Tax=Paludibacter sp. 221 TaxID=2302939 RepID=UPI0013D4B92D|nr:DUF5131 family protein [Paludibacter sp. 221]NDV45800.1 DUF5131 family protein [Paludibacter sp. 221]